MPIPITESRGHIRQYTITYSPVNNRRRQSGSVSVPGDKHSVVIGGLSPRSSYSVSVAAATGGGMGNISEPVTITPPPTTTGTTMESMCAWFSLSLSPLSFQYYPFITAIFLSLSLSLRYWHTSCSYWCSCWCSLYSIRHNYNNSRHLYFQVSNNKCNDTLLIIIPITCTCK